MLKPTIVAIDDSNVYLMTIEKILKEDYTVKCFSQPQRALAYMESNVPALILLDIDMPNLNGYDMIKIIKKKENLANVKVIFLTSNADKQHVVKAVQNGADGYIIKVLDDENMREKIKGFIGRK